MFFSLIRNVLSFHRNVLLSHKDLENVTRRKDLVHMLKTSDVFINFNFKILSVSTTNFKQTDFTYF